MTELISAIGLLLLCLFWYWMGILKGKHVVFKRISVKGKKLLKDVGDDHGKYGRLEVAIGEVLDLMEEIIHNYWNPFK